MGDWIREDQEEPKEDVKMEGIIKGDRYRGILNSQNLIKVSTFD